MKRGIQTTVGFKIQLLLFFGSIKHASPTFHESSEHLQDRLLTKLLGQFTWDSIVLIFSIEHFKKLGVNIAPESIYMKE